MKVLMFSSDPKLREEGSAVSERIKKYGEVLEKLDVILLDRSRGRFLRFFHGYREARKLLAGERYDLITAQEPEHWFLAWRLSKKFGVLWQAQIHTDIFSPYFFSQSFLNKARVLLGRFLIPRASCVRAVSERIKKSIKRDAAVLPIYHRSEDRSGTDVRKKYPGYDFYVLMVSRLTSEKNVKLALEVFREFIKKYPRSLLVIVGDGPERDFLENERKIGLEANVRFEGWQEDLTGYYQSSDCLLLTSNYEGYGLVAVEAMNYGCPVIMTDVGVADEVVKEGENGMVVPVGHKKALLLALLKLRGDKIFREKLKEGARKTPMPYRSFEEYREKLVESWRRCVQK